MFTDFFADLINALLSGYVEGITKEQTKFSITKQKFELENLQLYKHAFLQHEIPLIVERGIISKLNISTPIKSLSELDCSVDCKDVQILCKPLFWKNSMYISREEGQKVREHQILSHELFKKTFNSFISILSDKSSLLGILGLGDEVGQ